MKVSIDTERCQGHGRCYDECPEVFTSDDEGFSTISVTPPPATLDAAVARAAESCPERAIRISTE
jgi:ferredoxin